MMFLKTERLSKSTILQYEQRPENLIRWHAAWSQKALEQLN
jgi:hypothetical protein